MFFALAGAIGPFLARILLFESVHRLGAALTGTLGGIYPLFASFIAIIFLGEKITLLIFLGTFSIILGVGIISRMERGSQRKFRKLYICIPILSALFFGLADPIRKLGLNLLDSPILGAAIGTTTALVCLTLLLAYRGEISLPINERIHVFRIIWFNYELCSCGSFFCIKFWQGCICKSFNEYIPLICPSFFPYIFERNRKSYPFSCNWWDINCSW